MTIKVAINGFGRIGRNVARAIISDHTQEIDLLAINDSASVETNLHLLKYDSIHGALVDKIEKINSDLFKINKNQIKKFSSKYFSVALFELMIGMPNKFVPAFLSSTKANIL